MRNIIKRGIILLAATLFFTAPFGAGTSVKASAGAAVQPAYADGVPATGGILLNTDTPVKVEKVNVTLDIPELPPLWFGSEEAFAAYKSHAETAYTLYDLAVLIVTGYDLSLYAKARADETELPVAVRGLVEIHEIHVDR